MTIKIPSDALKQSMQLAQAGCPDGGVAYCYDCARKFVLATLEQLDLHTECVSLHEFPTPEALDGEKK